MKIMDLFRNNGNSKENIGSKVSVNTNAKKLGESVEGFDEAAFAHYMYQIVVNFKGLFGGTTRAHMIKKIAELSSDPSFLSAIACLAEDGIPVTNASYFIHMSKAGAFDTADAATLQGVLKHVEELQEYFASETENLFSTVEQLEQLIEKAKRNQGN